MRWAWLLGGLGVSVLLTALLWGVFGPGAAFLLLLPFMFPIAARPRRSCPSCHASWPAGMLFCPDDGTKLERSKPPPERS